MTRDVAEFERHRPLVFRVAYGMLGSAADAEDVLQETRSSGGTARSRRRSGRRRRGCPGCDEPLPEPAHLRQDPTGALPGP
ncbi:sigma factor [Prauserella sediminis]|uniref:sigma factor n=1 Tax=Prauserella sediminis TaxID=577680 RepID=UPI001E382F5E|nr:sigma factor [Prauserella sediminis]